MRAWLVMVASGAIGAAGGALAAQEARGALRAVVRDSAGIGIPFASITDVVGDQTRQADAGGLIALRSLPAGDRELRVRAIGFRPATVRVTILAGRTATVAIVLTRQVQVLPDLITSEPRAIAAGLARRLLRGGRFLAGETIRARGALRLTEALVWVPGLRLERRPTALGGPVLTFTDCGRARSTIAVWIDGREALAGRGSAVALAFLDDVRPREVEVLEVYRRYDEVPPELRRPDLCGAILVWTSALTEP